jgi:hypothetical protein
VRRNQSIGLLFTREKRTMAMNLAKQKFQEYESKVQVLLKKEGF